MMKPGKRLLAVITVIIAAFICVAICSYRGLLALLLTTISTSSPPSVLYCIVLTSTV